MESTSRTAVVIGGQGALGRAVLEGLDHRIWTVCPAGRHADGQPRFRHIDLDQPETVAAALRGADLVISAVADPNFTAERWVLEQGGLLVNCSHSAGRKAGQVKAENRQERGTVLLNAGLVPGIANVVAADLLVRHPDADCLEIAFTILQAGTAGKAGAEFVHRGLSTRSRHRVLHLPLPDPFGELAFIEIGEEEESSFSGVAGGRRVETYLGFLDRMPRTALLGLNAFRLMRLLPQAAFLPRSPRKEVTLEPTAIWVGARRGRDRLGAAVITCEGDYKSTAAAARMFVGLLPNDAPAGCFNPEDLFSLSTLTPQLERIGVHIGS